MALFDWLQFSVLAKELSARPDEAALRSAISRAYYAAYNTAKTFCSEKAFPISDTGNRHRDLWDAFLKKGGRTFTSVYEKGERLRRKRTKADYESDVPGLASMVTDSLRESDAILNFLRPKS